MRLVQSLKIRNYLHTRDCKGLIVWTWMWGPFALIDYRMGRLCGGAHEMSGIKAPLFLHGGWLEDSWGGWGWWLVVVMWVGGWILVG